MSDTQKAARYFQRWDELPSKDLDLPRGSGYTLRQQHHMAIYRLRLDTGERIFPRV